MPMLLINAMSLGMVMLRVMAMGVHMPLKMVVPLPVSFVVHFLLFLT